MIWKRKSELDASHRLAYDMGRKEVMDSLLDHEAAEAAFEKWLRWDVIHIEYHREATGGGPVEEILAAAQKGIYES